MSKILIVEDEEAIADLEKDYLELSDFEVTIENSGDKGLDTALSGNFDLVILDLNVKIDQLVQGHVIEHRQFLGLLDVRECLVKLPFGDGLTSYPQFFCNLLLRKTVFLSCAG